MSDFWQDESEDYDNTLNNDPFGNNNSYNSGTGTGTATRASLTRPLLSANEEISFISLAIAIITIFSQLPLYQAIVKLKIIDNNTFYSLLHTRLPWMDVDYLLYSMQSEKITRFGISTPLYLYTAVTLFIIFVIMYLTLVYMPRIFSYSSKIRVAICYVITFTATYLVLMGFTQGKSSYGCTFIVILMYITCLITRFAQNWFETNKFLGILFWICQILLIVFTSFSMLIMYFRVYQ